MANHPSAAVKASQVTALTNGKYHGDREGFLDFWDKAIALGIMASGATAFFDLFGVANQKLGSAIFFLFGLAQIVFSLSIRARKHAYLRERYFAIAAKLEKQALDPLSANAEMLELAGTEDPPYSAVHALAENWATRSILGDERSLPCRVGFFRRRLRNWLRQEDADFATPKR